MQIAFLGSPESWYLRDLRRAAGERHRIVGFAFPGLSVDLRNGDAAVCAAGRRLSDFDAVLVRSMPPGTLEQIVLRMDALAQVEAAGTYVLNPPRSMETAVDKCLATARLAGAGLPTPATHVSQQWPAAIEGFHSLGGDVVVKPIFGGEGRGLTRISDEDLALRAFKMLENLGAVIYQQQFVDHEGFDLRLLVLGDEVWGIRRRNNSDWRTNVSRGAIAEPLNVTDEFADLAMRATASVGAVFAGIDLLPGRDGKTYVLEVNGVPGWRALSQTLHVDIAAELLDHLQGR